MINVEVTLEDRLLEEVVDEDLADFDKFMQENVDDSGPLSGPEKAIIKTWIWWKTHPKDEEEDVETPSS